MRFPLRSILYSVVLLGALASASAWLYTRPSQVELRLERTLSRFTRRPVRLTGCSRGLTGPLRIRALEVPASPPIESRDLLVLENLTVGDPPDRMILWATTTGEDMRSCGVQSEEAVLSLDRQIDVRSTGERVRWNFDDLLAGPVTYLASVQRRFDGHPVLAAAAYNAGPQRVEQWLPSEPVAADLWVATIPFRETRGYVRRVLAYRVIYDYRLGRDIEPLSATMRPVGRGSSLDAFGASSPTTTADPCDDDQKT